MMIDYSGNKFNKLVLFSAIGLAFGLSACSGGGDDDGGTPVTPSTGITGVTVGGTAAKGIVKNGVVKAEELNASGAVIATVGSSRTDAGGAYSLALFPNYTGGPIQVSITSDINTEIKCDAPIGCGTRTDDLVDSDSGIDFGEFYKPGALTMTALLPVAASSETLSVSVTPFTHMAAARAKAAATLDATAVANANSEVSNLLGGIDILNTPPIDVTDSAAVSGATSAAQVTYAAFASALSSQGMLGANDQPDLNAALALLADSFVSGVIEADDADGDDAAQISLQEIVTAARETFTAAGIEDLTGKLASLQLAIDLAESDGGEGTIDPEPGTTVADTNLAKVKAMVSDVRTWGNVIEAETTTLGTAFEAQLNLAADAIGVFGAVDPIDVLAASIDAAFNFVSGTTDITLYDLGLDTFTSGIIDSTTPGVMTITDGVVHGYTVNITINMPEDGTAAISFNIGISSATIVNADNSMTITNGLADVTFADLYTIDRNAINLGTAVLPDATDLTFDLDVAFTQNVDASGAALPSQVTFAGTMASDLDVIPVINDPLNSVALPKTFSLSGEISNTQGDSMTASLAMNVSNTETFEYGGDINVIESIDNWIDADIGLTFSVQLNGLPEASVNIIADRTGFQAGTGVMTITYGDRQLSLSATGTSSQLDGILTVTNQDNVVLSFTQTDPALLTGDLSLNGINYGTLTETASGFLKISYTDGSFEIF